jgi:hypothetical protein
LAIVSFCAIRLQVDRFFADERQGSGTFVLAARTVRSPRGEPHRSRADLGLARLLPMHSSVTHLTYWFVTCHLPFVMAEGLQALGQKTAVNGETVPGDVGGRGKTEKRDRCRDFFGFCHASEWRSLQDLAQPFRLL